MDNQKSSKGIMIHQNLTIIDHFVQPIAIHVQKTIVIQSKECKLIVEDDSE